MILLLAGLIATTTAFASEGRTLPSGASNAAYVDTIFNSPRGEVHFVKYKDGNSLMLRTMGGLVAGLSFVQGNEACDTWIIATPVGTPPKGCDFVFYNQVDGTNVSVRSEEMEEASLFQAVKGTFRGQGGHVAL